MVVVIQINNFISDGVQFWWCRIVEGNDVSRAAESELGGHEQSRGCARLDAPQRLVSKRNLTVPVKNKLWYNKQHLPLPFKGVSISDIIYEIALLDQMRHSLFITARIARRQSITGHLMHNTRSCRKITTRHQNPRDRSNRGFLKS